MAPSHRSRQGSEFRQVCRPSRLESFASSALVPPGAFPTPRVSSKDRNSLVKARSKTLSSKQNIDMQKRWQRRLRDSNNYGVY